MFRGFIDKLEKELKGPLPGKDLQLAMSPAVRNAEKLYFEPNEQTRHGSVLILLYPDNQRICFPLIKRPEYPGVHSGQMALPGGKVEEDDPNPVYTAIRETEEEIGAERSNIKVIGVLSELFIYASNFMVLPVVAYQDVKTEFVPDQLEVASVIEADIRDLVDPGLRKRKKIRVSAGFDIDSPYFDIHGHVVWGATAMMLSEFSEIVSRLLKKKKSG